MMMKTMNLMIAITLCTSLLFSFTESADAQNSGSSISRKGNFPDLRFDLLKTAQEIEIVGEVQSDNSVLFRKAIGNFSYENGPNQNFPFADSVIFNFPVGNITAKLLNAYQAEYTIYAVDSFDLRDEPGNLKKSIFCSSAQPCSVYSFKLDISDLSQEHKISAVNNLQFIINSNLYNPSRIQNEVFVKDTLGFDLAIPSLKPIEEGGSGYECKTILDGTDCTNAGIRVPEPSTSLASLLFGAFGLGVLRKRKMKMKQS